MLPFIQSTYLASLLESFSEGVMIMNVKGDVYAANRMAGRMLGMECDTLLEGPLNGLVLERFLERGEVEGFLARAREREAPASRMQARYRHPATGVRQFTLSSSQLIEYGKVFGIVLQVGDVTHIYEMHEREKRMLEERSVMQQERIDSLAQLSMAIAHQIRNPLMTIGGFAGLLERKVSLDKDGAAFVHTILEGAKRLEAVVTAVVAYTASRTPACLKTDVAALVWRTADRLDPLPPQVRIDAAAQGPQWSLDPALTGDALYELLLNAVEAMTAGGGVVTVTWREETDVCALEVSDQGRGVPPEAVPFLFDPFFTTKAVGVGMGLAKARRWIREQGGDLFLANTAGGGARAVLSIPRMCGGVVLPASKTSAAACQSIGGTG